MTRQWIWILILLWASPAVAASWEQPAAWGQSSGLGGNGTAFVNDHSAITVNPAGISILDRYSGGAAFIHEGDGAGFDLSVVDNRTSPMAMGVDYQNLKPRKGHAAAWGAVQKHRLTLSAAEFYGEKAYLGFSYHFRLDKMGAPQGLTETVKRKNHNFSTGLIVPVAEKANWSIVSRDILWFTKNAPDPTITSGIAWMPHPRVGLFVDVTQLTDNIRHWTGSVSTELLALDQIALRGAWRQDFYATGRPMTWNAGVGWYFPKGQMFYGFERRTGKVNVHVAGIEINLM
ncbi:MAG: hypothetical protein D6761_09060 [Candidatus Dadabacteria bacterium]|nr:MAG: hypothetical protein D6761_09060 [Candidatus Dadabacteria bacterium]